MNKTVFASIGLPLIKEVLCWQRQSYNNKDKTVLQPSYLHNMNPYMDKTASLYWNSPYVYYYQPPYKQHSTVSGEIAFIHVISLWCIRDTIYTTCLHAGTHALATSLS